MRRVLFLGLGLVATQGAARAVDDYPVVQQPAALVGPSGYVDLHVGFGSGSENGTYDDGDES